MGTLTKGEGCSKETLGGVANVLDEILQGPVREWRVLGDDA